MCKHASARYGPRHPVPSLLVPAALRSFDWVVLEKGGDRRPEAIHVDQK